MGFSLDTIRKAIVGQNAAVTSTVIAQELKLDATFSSLGIFFFSPEGRSNCCPASVIFLGSVNGSCSRPNKRVVLFVKKKKKIS